MTKEKLSEIVKLQKEIKQLKNKLQETDYGDNNNYVSDKVTGSSAQYPYTARSFTIHGYEGMSEGCIKKRNEISKKISDKYSKLFTQINNAYDYIDSIEDSDIRQILMYKYIDGLTWEQIGQKMNYSWETVRKKHDKFIKSIPPNTSSKDL